MKKIAIIVFTFVLAVSAVQAEETAEAPAPEPASAATSTPTTAPATPAPASDIPVLEKLWETEAEFQQPESVLYGMGVLYVSNVAGEATGKDGVGYLSKVALDGTMVQKEWIKGLNAPKGMAYYENRLYVSDIDTLVEIDINTGKIVDRYPAAGAQFLNDVAVDGGGNVYVSDMMTDTIHRLSNGRFEVWLHNEALQSPNGLYAESDRLLVGTWGVRADGFKTTTSGHLEVINFGDSSLKPLGAGDQVGNLDGVEGDGNGNYYVTDWMAGKLFFFKPDGTVTPILQLEPGAADLGFIMDRGMMVIPLMNSGKLIAYAIKQEDVTPSE